jgi:hypothetical protein
VCSSWIILARFSPPLAPPSRYQRSRLSSGSSCVGISQMETPWSGRRETPPHIYRVLLPLSKKDEDFEKELNARKNEEWFRFTRPLDLGATTPSTDENNRSSDKGKIQRERGERRKRYTHALETMMLLTVSLASVNSVLLVVLLFVYGKIVLKTKAMYAVGLMIFAFLLLAQNLLSVFAFVTMQPFFGSEALPYLSGIAALELGGLVALLRITLC